MFIVEEVQSDSTRRHQRIKKEIRSLTLAKFASENITLFNGAMLERFRELDNADVLEDDLLLTLYEAYMSASTEIFRVTFITSRRDLEVFIRQIKNKDSAARAILAAVPGAKTFTYRTIMEEAHQLYRDLVESELWTPGILVKSDRTGAPVAFACHAEANSLVANSPATVTCYNCQGQGHMARECPHPARQPGEGSGGRGRGRGRGRGGPRGRGPGRGRSASGG